MGLSNFLDIPDRLPDFAEIAIELKLIERDICFREISFSAKLETYVANERRQRLWLDAHRVGLAPMTISSMLDDWTARARACAENHRIIKALIPHEGLIRDLVAKTETGT